MVVVWYALLVAAPAVTLHLGMRGLDRWSRGSPRKGQQSTEPTLERMVCDLQRLEREYRSIETADVPARGARMRAVQLAYDDTLRGCCAALGLPEPSSPLSSLDRLQTEAALAQRGLTW